MNNNFSFRETLAERQKETGNVVCVGLDPKMSKIPKEFEKFGINGLYQWMKMVVDVSADRGATMFKPQSAHWEAINGGKIVLKTLIAYIKGTYPNILVFEDCKRGDIGGTQTMYRDAILGTDGAQGMNFSPYMGEDCYSSLLDKNNPGNSIVGLCRTSNPKAWPMQDVIVGGENGMTYYEYIATQMDMWTQEKLDKNAGLVMGAAHEYGKFGYLKEHAKKFPGLNFRIPEGEPGDFYSEHFVHIRKIVGDRLWLLIPGIGSQTGSKEDNIRALKATINDGYTGPGSIAINSSSGISEAHLKKENEGLSFDKVVEKEVDFLVNQTKKIINELDTSNTIC